MSANYDVIDIFPIDDSFRAIRKTDSGRMVYNSNIFIKTSIISYKNIANTTLILLLWVKLLFLPKNADFLQKNGDNSRFKGVLVLKVTFSKTTYLCVLKYQISSF